MDASAVPSTETSINNPAAAKRPRLEAAAVDDEHVSIVDVRLTPRTLPRNKSPFEESASDLDSFYRAPS